MALTVNNVATALRAVDSSRATLWRRASLCVIAAELLLLFAPTVRFLVDRWTVSVWHNAHGMFVPPVAAWLIWHSLKTPTALPARGSAWGFAFLLPALVIHAIDAGIHTELLSAIALILILPGLALLFLGTERTRAIAFPLFFMIFALPIPLGLTETIHLVLRHITVAATSALLPLLGVSIFTEGTTIHIVHGAVEIADACSGFSTLYAALAVATLTAYASDSIGRRVLVFALAAPIAIASNVLRVLLLIALITVRGEAVLNTFLHPLSGMLTFALTLPLIFWLGGPASQRAETRGA